METDERLYQRWLNGEEDALRVLLERHRESLTCFIMGYVHSMDDAEELMLDAFVVIATGRARFSGESAFKTWLFAIGRNLARKHLRRKRLSVGVLPNIPDRNEDVMPEISLLKSERNRHLYEAMRTLPEEYRQALFLLEFESMDAEDVARVMGKSRKQVYNLSFRSRKALKEALNRSGFDHAQY